MNPENPLMLRPYSEQTCHASSWGRSFAWQRPGELFKDPYLINTGELYPTARTIGATGFYGPSLFMRTTEVGPGGARGEGAWDKEQQQRLQGLVSCVLKVSLLQRWWIFHRVWNLDGTVSLIQSRGERLGSNPAPAVPALCPGESWRVWGDALILSYCQYCDTCLFCFFWACTH